MIMRFWAARYKNGNTLFLWDDKPIWDDEDEVWYSSGNYFDIDKNLFPEVTFENSPQEVELKLCNNE